VQLEDLLLVTPVADGVDDVLKLAIAQIDQWGNWLGEAPRMVKYAAVTGGVLIEVDDDDEREKVGQRIVWPSLVKEKREDAAGNLKAYTLEYKAKRKDGTQYLYRKEVDGEEEVIRKFEDDRLTEAIDLPYGFVPAVYIKHEDDGFDEGSPAVWNMDKVDRLNSDICHTHDYFHKVYMSHKIISVEKGSRLDAITGASKNSDGSINMGDPRFSQAILLAEGQASVHDLMSTADVGHVYPYLKDLRESFEADYPELQAREIIQNKAQVSGAALERMLSPSQAKLDRAAANYNQQVIKLKQMSVAIAGWRYSGNGWGKRDAQQKRFADFNLNSYAQGKLNFGLKRSLLVQSSPMEEEELKAKKVERAKNLDGIVDALTQIMEAGYSEERAKEILRARTSVDTTLENEQ
jgi:hypothetical protein